MWVKLFVVKLIISVPFGSFAYTFLEPKGMVDAQHSIPYALAVVSYEKKAFIEQFTEEKVNDPRIRNLASRVTVELDKGLDEEYIKTKKRPDLVEVQCKDGGVLRNQVYFPKGEVENPLTDEEIIEKFQNLSSMAIRSENVSKIISLWEKLEDIKNMSELGILLQA